MRWWDGAAWTDRVATGGRVASDPTPAGDATADLVNRVIATALGFVDLADTLREPIPEATVVPALWRDAGTRRDILVLAHGHLAALEQLGREPARAQALAWLTTALDPRHVAG